MSLACSTGRSSSSRPAGRPGRRRRTPPGNGTFSAGSDTACPTGGACDPNSDYRTTLIAGKDPRNADRELRIRAGEAHIFQVPIPASMRRQADEFDILIEVTLSYAAQPRRTRRNHKRYLSTWVNWKSSKLGEAIESFRRRALKDQEDEGQAKGTKIPWMLHENPMWGTIRGVKRNSVLVQKDWAVVKSNALPDSFCIAVVGHKGWSNDPDSSARYAITVSFEVVAEKSRSTKTSRCRPGSSGRDRGRGPARG